MARERHCDRSDWYPRREHRLVRLRAVSSDAQAACVFNARPAGPLPTTCDQRARYVSNFQISERLVNPVDAARREEQTNRTVTGSRSRAS